MSVGERLFGVVVVAILATFVLYLVFCGAPAAAEGMRNCAPRDVVLTRLTDKYSEDIRMMGLGSSGAVVEVLASGGGRDLDNPCHVSQRAGLPGGVRNQFRSAGPAAFDRGR